MKNNVITILVDSVFSECLSKGRTSESSTPFLDSIIPNSLYTSNIFSYGPYTDAATKGLFCGNKTLDDYGYYYGINSSEYNHFRIFKEAGYETVGLYYPYYLISSKVEKNIDYSVYISGFLYESFWNGYLSYYADKKKNEGLSELEYKIIEKCISMLFDCWGLFYHNLENDFSGIIINRIKREELNGKELLIEEKQKYENNKKEYIDLLLEQGMKHKLSKINDYDYNRLVLKNVLKKVFKIHKKFFNHLSFIEFKQNLKNNRPSLKKIFEILIGVTGKRYFANFGMSLFGNAFLKNKSMKNMWQIEASMMNQINAIFHYIDNKYSGNKPFYISMHTEEPHNRLAYFSYDICDLNLINEELEYLKPLVNNLGNKFAGHVIYQLSLRYVDLCLKRLFNGLKERGLLDNTTIMVMADHGSSYTLNPLRDTAVNNFFLENYKTPLLIWNNDDSSKWKKVYNGYYQGADVFPTLCDTLGIEYKNKFRGKSIISFPEGKEYVITEYMGPGCPDMLNREVWMSINNKKYLVAIKVKINNVLNESCIVEIYDLISDPFQFHNIINNLRDNLEIKSLLDKLNTRYKEIVESTKNILLNFDTFKVTL